MKRLEQEQVTTHFAALKVRLAFVAHFQCADDLYTFNQTLHVWLPSDCRFAAQQFQTGINKSA
ncbi:MAG: hypothetical protein ACRD4L_07755 [Pyrinomonadaceae bacterium]